MKVKDLIDSLQSMPKEAKVFHLWDGHARTEINHVWLSKIGHVITADNGEVCYSDGDRPIDAPTTKQKCYWTTPILEVKHGAAKRITSECGVNMKLNNTLDLSEQQMINYRKFRGKSKELAEAAISREPTLRLVRGYYYCHTYGKQPHWWCEKRDGTVVDLSARQYPSNGNGVYEPLDAAVRTED